MIPYEELCAALERHRADHGPADPPEATKETVMPPAGADEEHTAIGNNMQPIYEDRSNELDIGDVLSDEEVPKS